MAEKQILHLKLVGAPEENGLVYFNEFRDFCDGVSVCLSRVETIISGKQAKIKYKIVGLQLASAGITLEAVKASKGRDRRGRVLNLFNRTVKAIEKGKRVDRRLGADDLRAFKKLATPLRRAKEVWIDEQQITPVFAQRVDQLLNRVIPSEGSVRGKLERLNVHDNSSEFVLFPPIPGHQVVCEFPEDMLEEVKQAIPRSVTVTGTLYFRADRPFPDKVRVKSMKVHPFSTNLPGLLELRGMAPGCTGDLTSVEFVQALRND